MLDECALPSSAVEAPPSDEYTQGLTEDDKKASYLYTWLVSYLTHLQTVFRLPYDAILKFLQPSLLCYQKYLLCAPLSQLNFQDQFIYYIPALSNNHLPSTYVVCKKCHMIYSLNDCIEGSGAYQHGRMCMYQEFPNHPHSRLGLHVSIHF